jgi:hypothetical protein
VAFPQKGSSQSYIFPALLESIPEEKNWQEKECITTEFVYIDFMPKAIVNQLSAELSDFIQIDIDGQEEVWNNAVNLVYEGLGKDQTATKCQVMEYFYKRKIIVNAVGPDARGLMMKIMVIDQDIFLEMVIWENFIDAISKTGLQEEYNKAARQADIFISLFFTKVGPYTKKEFETAFTQFTVSGKPLIYTYFKEAEINIKDVSEEDIGGLRDFQKKLGDLGHYYTTYTSTEDLKNQFRSQLEKLMHAGSI